MKRTKRAKTEPISKGRRAKRLSLFIVIPLILVSLFVIAATTYKIVEIVITNNPPTDFPKLEISLAEVPIEEIDANSKNIKYPGNTVTLTVDDKTTTFENVEIKGRGNSTWLKIKKPYQIKFNEKVSLFDYTPAKKWILLANSFDSTYLKTDTAFKIVDILSNDSALGGKFIELNIDESYRGLYYLTEKLEIGKSHIKLTNPLGVLMELDNLYKDNNECYYDKAGDCLIVKDIVNEDQKDASMEDVIANFNALKSAIKSKNYHEIKKIIDIDSFARYFLLSEFIINPDAYSTSLFIYKDGPEDKIHIGPGWDFDLAFKQSFDKPKESRKEFTEHNSAFSVIFDLIEIPEFMTRVKEIYQETLSGKGDELLDYVRSQAEYIRPAALRDQERWKLKTNFDDEVEYLIDWIAKRYNYFEENYGVNSNPAPESPQPSQEL